MVDVPEALGFGVWLAGVSQTKADVGSFFESGTFGKHNLHIFQYISDELEHFLKIGGSIHIRFVCSTFAWQPRLGSRPS